ncbi:MAG: hypothetical protein WDW38_003690 [Sanguina aurantia]
MGAPVSSDKAPPTYPGFDLQPAQLQQLEVFLDYMLEINKVMNLTGIREKGEARQRHVADSLSLIPIIESGSNLSIAQLSPSAVASASNQFYSTSRYARQEPVSRGNMPSADRGSKTVAGKAAVAAAASIASEAGTKPEGVSLRGQALSVIDVGTGPGLPGIIFAVARPLWKVTLLDSLRKRCDFLKKAIELMGLTNVEVVWSRAEDAGQDPVHRQGYDVAVARAVAETRTLAELCLPFVKVGGLWVAAKGPTPKEEVAGARVALQKLGGVLCSVELVDSFSSDGQRTAVVVRKVANTPAQYPRGQGLPGKSPL